MNYCRSKIGEPWRGYYLTAYGIAVKHGFVGTEEEWLESLHGASVELRYDETAEALQIRSTNETEWSVLMTLDELRGDVVSQTIEEAEAAADAAEAARSGAENAENAAEAASAEAAVSAQTAAENAASALSAAAAASDSSAAAGDFAAAAESAASTADTASGEARSFAAEAKSWAVGGTGVREGEDADNAKYWSEASAASASGAGAMYEAARAEADRAEAEAERASVPAVEGVYNIILADRETGKRYALLMEGGSLCYLEVRQSMNATDLELIDPTTGKSYTLGVENGGLYIQEIIEEVDA